jgi:hypothetical protein
MLFELAPQVSTPPSPPPVVIAASLPFLLGYCIPYIEALPILAFIQKACGIVEPITTAAKSVPIKHGIQAQSSQDTRHLSSRPNWDPPPLRVRGDGVPTRTRGQTLWYSTYVLCGYKLTDQILLNYVVKTFYFLVFG